MSDKLPNITIMIALEQFEAAEANLLKLERLWSEISNLVSSGINFGPNSEYEDRARSYGHVLKSLPKIDGWRPEAEPEDIDRIAQQRFDAMEIGEPHAQSTVERWIEEPGSQLREYRFRLINKRRQLIRDTIVGLIDAIDADLRNLRIIADNQEENKTKIDANAWSDIREHIKQIEVLLGSTKKPGRWLDMMRHIHFGLIGDLDDIEHADWPNIKDGLRQGLYGVNEPIPVQTGDLGDLVAARPSGPITAALNWGDLDDEGFERLIFRLISETKGYENPEWLMQTRAPDRGRDLSVTHVVQDELSGVTRSRVVIQCKHWRSRSVSLPDVAGTKEQMALWNAPIIDLLVVATSGRFTADAVAWVEAHNQKGIAPRIQMWPESHLERLLASRPALIAEFGLRG